MMFKKLRKIATSRLAGAIIFRILRLYCKTLRLKLVNEDQWLEYLQNGGRVLICAWHQQFFAGIKCFDKYRNFNPSLMISKSLDGEIIAGVANRCGWYSVRGSSSRDGGSALKEMVLRLRQNRLAVHILDGPRGPKGVVKAGAISLAYEGEACMVPTYVEAERAWYFQSWDKFMLPKPFSRVTIHFAEMIKPMPLRSDNDFENRRLALEAILKPHLR